MRETEAQEKFILRSGPAWEQRFLDIVQFPGPASHGTTSQSKSVAINAALDPYRQRIGQVAVESTYNWYWFVDGLRQQGMDVRLANPAKMDQYEGLKATNDASDAGWIAEQMRLGILPEAYIYPPEVPPIRDALRRRMLIVRQRTRRFLV